MQINPVTKKLLPSTNSISTWKLPKISRTSGKMAALIGIPHQDYVPVTYVDEVEWYIGLRKIAQC